MRFFTIATGLALTAASVSAQSNFDCIRWEGEEKFTQTKCYSQNDFNMAGDAVETQAEANGFLAATAKCMCDGLFTIPEYAVAFRDCSGGDAFLKKREAAVAGCKAQSFGSVAKVWGMVIVTRNSQTGERKFEYEDGPTDTTPPVVVPPVVVTPVVVQPSTKTTPVVDDKATPVVTPVSQVGATTTASVPRATGTSTAVILPPTTSTVIVDAPGASTVPGTKPASSTKKTTSPTATPVKGDDSTVSGASVVSGGLVSAAAAVAAVALFI